MMMTAGVRKVALTAHVTSSVLVRRGRGVPGTRNRGGHQSGRADRAGHVRGNAPRQLTAERGIGFEDVVFHIERGDLLDTVDHPNPSRYAGQRMFIVRREDYVYLVPFVEDEHTMFLKTIIPSRKATKQY
jgi:hypothetical protein